MERTEIRHPGHAGELFGIRWQPDNSIDHLTTDYVVLLVHGYGEHIGRYEHVAERLVADRAAVYGHDHVGHGRSEGERVLIGDFEPVVEDVHRLSEIARREHPDLPIVLIGHSMGGMIAARYAQRYAAELTSVVLSGPVLGRWDAVSQLLAADEIPDVPIDVSTLSRDDAVGEVYAKDDLVWHGPFKRETLEGLRAEIDTISEAGVSELPILWIHGEEDQLVPIDGTREGWNRLAGHRAEAKSYPGARHEIFNETNQDEVLGDTIAFIRRHLPTKADVRSS